MLRGLSFMPQTLFHHVSLRGLKKHVVTHHKIITMTWINKLLIPLDLSSFIIAKGYPLLQVYETKLVIFKNCI